MEDNQESVQSPPPNKQWHKRRNYINEGLERGLTPKQELFAQTVAGGGTLSEAQRNAGYGPTSNGVASRVIRQEQVQLRVIELIEERQFLDMTGCIWYDIMGESLRGLEPGSTKWCNVADRQLKAIEQIARLGGWEPKRVEETRKLVLKGDISSILPTDSDSSVKK